MSANSKTWFPTRHQHLYRHKSGNYYVRLGKRSWRSLKTKVVSIALKRRDEALAHERAREELAPASEIIEIKTMGDAFAVRRRQIENDPALKASTRKFWNDILNSLPKIWPGIERKNVTRLTAEECETWAGMYSKSVSASHFNHVLSALRNSAKIVVKAGIRHTNPFGEIKQRRAVGKDLTGKLPSREKFAQLVAEVRKSPSRWGNACGDLVEFLAYSGVRIGEAKWIQWKHCDLARGELVVVGEPEEGTKNRKIRRVPMIAELEKLIRRMIEHRLDATLESQVLEVFSANKSIKRAAKILGLESITHHDLRHLYATTCIESGVDIPTLSRWLGHTDDGILAMKTYGHLRNEHSLAQAKKVSFK